jgi:integrase
VGFEPTNPCGKPESVDSLLAKYLNYLMTRKTIKPATIERKIKTIRSMVKNHGVDLSNPDEFVRFLNTVEWKSGSKDIAVDSYRDYLDMIGLTMIKLPHIRREETLPFVPLEVELDALISAISFRIGAFLRLLKDTGVRPIEAWRLTWLDIDVANKCVTITPAKYSRPRKLKITEATLNLIMSLPRRNQHVWSPSGVKDRFNEELSHFTRNYVKQRRRIALKLKNPRISQITLRTFRHWKGTMEYARTKDIIYVKELLGHVNIQNTIKYIHLANVLSNLSGDFVCKVAKTLEEATQLIEAGFEYVTDMDSVKIFRKRK